jgi:hypothetical protein
VPLQLGANGSLDGWPVLAVVVEAIANVGPSVSGNKVNPNGWNLDVPQLPSEFVGVRGWCRRCSSSTSSSSRSSPS